MAAATGQPVRHARLTQRHCPMAAQITQIWLAIIEIRSEHPAMQIGGSVCGPVENPSRSVTRYQAVAWVAGRRR
jgi:hypothetical protein